MMHVKKAMMKFDINPPLCWILILALITIGSNGTAQLISVQRTTTDEKLQGADTVDGEDSRRLSEPEIQSAGFTATEPQKLFAENIVYVDPSQEPITAEPNIVLPQELTIPPTNDDPFELPDMTPPMIPHPSNGPSGCADESIHNFKVPDDDGNPLSFSNLMRERYSAYRSEQSKLAWLPGHGERFGWLDWQSDPYLRRGDEHGITGAANVHWLAGPVSSPLPPRLWDFTLGYQVRNKFSDQFSYDLFTSVGAFSDFEGSARKGIRFPSHAVGMFRVNHDMDFVFGVDYLDRDDIPGLPVIGVSVRDVFTHGLRMDLVFPRPRIDYMLSETNRMYLTGQMGGGTWQVDFPDATNPVMTYRDFRLMLGIESTDKDGSLSAWEFGYVFGRHLEFRNQPGDTHFDNAFVLQWVSRR